MNRQTRKLLILGIVLSLIGGACAAPPPPTPTPDPLGWVKTFQDTYNKRDTEGFLALFDDNAVWDVVFYATGKKAVRNIVEFWFPLNSQIELSDCKLDNNNVSCKYTYSGDDCFPPEHKAIHLDVTFLTKQGKILNFSGRSSDAAEDTAIGNYQNQMLAWAGQNLPEDLAKFNTVDLVISGEQGGGKLTATELGQVTDRMCVAYAKAKK